MNMLQVLAVASGKDDECKFHLEYKGHKIEYLNVDGDLRWDDSKFFVAGFEFGPSVVVHVHSYREGYEQAWGAWLDSMTPIPDEELIEAYARDGNSGSFLDDAINAYPGRGEGRWTDADWATIKANARVSLNAAVDAAEESGDYPEVVEGYEMRDDGQIVSLGHYAGMSEADLEDLEIVLDMP